MVAIASADGEQLEIIGHRGFPESVVTPFRHLPIRDPTPAATAYQRCAPEIIETLAEFRARYPCLAARTAGITGTCAVLCFPLLVDGKAIGVIGLTFHEDRQFSPEERAAALALADRCAQALDRAR